MPGATYRLMLALGAMLAAPASLAAAPHQTARGIAPVCAVASHERLMLRAGRDICASTLNRAGRPTAAGFLPTTCPLPSQIYIIDAAGLADRCLNPSHKEK